MAATKKRAAHRKPPRKTSAGVTVKRGPPEPGCDVDLRGFKPTPRVVSAPIPLDMVKDPSTESARE